MDYFVIKKRGFTVFVVKQCHLIKKKHAFIVTNLIYHVSYNFVAWTKLGDKTYNTIFKLEIISQSVYLKRYNFLSYPDINWKQFNEQKMSIHKYSIYIPRSTYFETICFLSVPP